jgi:hypothetical protein
MPTSVKKKAPCWSERDFLLLKRFANARTATSRNREGFTPSSDPYPKDRHHVGGRSAGLPIFAAASQMNVPEVVIDLSMNTPQRHLA